MSLPKPFLFAMVCQAVGVEEVRQKVGVNATGRAFNSLEAIERGPELLHQRATGRDPRRLRMRHGSDPYRFVPDSLVRPHRVVVVSYSRIRCSRWRSPKK